MMGAMQPIQTLIFVLAHPRVTFISLQTSISSLLPITNRSGPELMSGSIHGAADHDRGEAMLLHNHSINGFSATQSIFEFVFIL